MNPISIYIVEDELLISASLKSQLQQFGYEISGSSIRGESCLEEIAELSRQGREPEIVLMYILVLLFLVCIMLAAPRIQAI